MKLHHFYDALLAYAQANTIDELTQLCSKHCQQLGFDFFVYALRIPSQFSEARLVVINGYPDSWVDHYFERSFYEMDPVLKFCRQHVIPIQWHELPQQANSESEQFMNEAAEFGLKNGISMPIHSPQGELGVFSLALDRRLVAAQDVTQHAMPYVQLLASHLHEAVRRVFELASPVGKLQLTTREQECLRWIADGKTSWEIGQLLGMSERTVNFHLNNAMVKLDVCNRQHAVAKAVLQGLVNPRPF